MNTTIVVSEPNAVPRGGSSVQDIPLGRIHESTTNPRRVFDETKLREFADNIRLHGVLQAILVRPAPTVRPAYTNWLPVRAAFVHRS